MQGLPGGSSESFQYRKRRQRWLILLLAGLVVLAALLLGRGIMLLPSAGAAALATTPRGMLTPTAAPSPIPTPPAPAIQAIAGMMIDTSNGDVLFTKNADKELAMASTTKVMTAIIALEGGNLDQPVTIGADAVKEGSGGDSHMGLSTGEVLTLRQLLYGLLLPSGDDAAVAIADAVAKERQANFIDLMNQQAQYLGLTHTHYVNPDGLDVDGHYTSARDLVYLTRYALRFPTFISIVSTNEYRIPATHQHKAYDLQNTNELLSPNGGYTGADGVKTGTTGSAGECLVFSAKRGEHHLVGVVLNDPNDTARYADARALLDWGFSVVGGA
jgi:D-alanyl-D-alanine carboxypeptidase (penicillin-binding protein 5/6)